MLLPLITFIKNISKKTLITYKKQEAKIFYVVKVMEAKVASITGKNRDRGSIFSQETARATGDLTNKKYFCFLTFIPHSLSMQIFIKIWYTENNIVKN